MISKRNHPSWCGWPLSLIRRPLSQVPSDFPFSLRRRRLDTSPASSDSRLVSAAHAAAFCRHVGGCGSGSWSRRRPHSPSLSTLSLYISSLSLSLSLGWPKSGEKTAESCPRHELCFQKNPSCSQRQGPGPLLKRKGDGRWGCAREMGGCLLVRTYPPLSALMSPLWGRRRKERPSSQHPNGEVCREALMGRGGAEKVSVQRSSRSETWS